MHPYNKQKILRLLKIAIHKKKSYIHFPASHVSLLTLSTSGRELFLGHWRLYSLLQSQYSEATIFHPDPHPDCSTNTVVSDYVLPWLYSAAKNIRKKVLLPVKKIDYVAQDILNLKGYQNRIVGSIDT